MPSVATMVKNLFAIRGNVLREGSDRSKVMHFAGSVHEALGQMSRNSPAEEAQAIGRPEAPPTASEIQTDPKLSGGKQPRTISAGHQPRLVGRKGHRVNRQQRTCCAGLLAADGRTSSLGRVRLFRDATRLRRRGKRKSQRDPTLLPASIQRPVGATRHRLPTCGPCDPTSASKGCRCGQIETRPPPAGV